MEEKKSVMKRILIDPFMVPPDALDQIIKDGKKSLFQEASDQIAEGAYYKIIYKIRTEDDPIQQMDVICFNLDIEPLRLIHMKAVYKQPEEIYLYRSERSLKDKLRNCIRYLKDRSGGRIEWRETDEGI